MAKVKDNILLQGFSGTIGKSLTFRQIGGQTFVSNYQKPPTGEPTEKAVAARTKFGEATAYARRVVKDPVQKALYQARVQGAQRAFNIAVMDAMQPPVVENIQVENFQGRGGDAIFIRATDDFKVVTVTILIHNSAGDLLEQGNAVYQENRDNWLYNLTQNIPALMGSRITAMATDLPGNSSSAEMYIQ
jgi:hypothetical protein